MTVRVYPAYRDSGLSWLSQVPAHWELRPPKHYIKTQAGGTLIKGDCSPEHVDGLFPGYSASGQDVWLTEYRYNAPGLVLSAVGARCGKVFKADGTWGVVANTACLLPRLNADRDFLWHLTNNEDWWEKGGTAQPYVRLSETMARCWAFPPLNEQAAIAAFLDRETGKIDALVAEQERLIALLKEKRQAVISHAVTKGLNPKAPMKDSGVPWLGDVPAHWEVKRIKYVARLESGHTPSKQFPEYWEGGDIEWVSLNDTKYLAANDYISETAVKITEAGIANSSARLLPPGSVVFTRDATIGLTAITTKQMAVSQHLIAWCPNKQIDEVYLLRVFDVLKPFLDASTSGATLKTIGMPDVKKLVTPVPSPDEQAQIVNWLSKCLIDVDVLAEEATRAITLLRERRAVLISAAVTGKIDVRETLPAMQNIV